MPRLPDVTALGDRPIPRSDRQIYSVRGATAAGEALAQAGSQLTDFAEKRMKEQDDLESTYATAAFLKAQAEWEASDDRDYETMPKRYGEQFGIIAEDGKFTPGKSVVDAAAQIRNPKRRALFEAGASQWVARGYATTLSKAKTVRDDDGMAKLNLQKQTLLEAYQTTKDPVMRQKIEANFNSVVDASKQFMGANAEQQALKEKTDFTQTNAKLAWAARPDIEKLDIIREGLGKPDGKQPLSVRNNNPGNLRDPSTVEFRKFATAEEGKAAMEADLRAKIGGKSPAMAAKYGKGYTPTIASLLTVYAPPSENDTDSYIATVSKDTGIAPDATLTEGDIAKIMPSMIKVEGGAAGTSAFGKTGTEFDRMSPADRIAEYDRVQKAIIKDDELRRKDPAQWGIEHGLTVNQVVAVQPDPFFASVIPQDTAKENVADLNKFQSVNDVVSYATNLQQQYGAYAPNALRDLKTAGMKPPFEAAIALTLQNPTAYKEHIELFSEIGVTGDKGVASLFKEKGYDATKLDKLITEKTEEWGLMRSNEGMTLNEYSENVDILRSLVQAKMVKDGTEDYDAALEFAMQPEAGNFATAELNGVMYRVPKTDKDGGKYDVDAIEARVASAYADILPKIAEANKKKGFHLSDAIIPYLNKEGDGLEFMTPIREPILDKDGNRVVLKFDDVIANESREERVDRIRNELMTIPYGERDTFREKAFGIKIRKDKKNVSP